MYRTINDIVIKEPLPSILPESGVYPNMLILGGGRGVWEEYFEAREIMPRSYVMCINDIGAQFKVEKVHHIVSLHKRILPAIKAFRRDRGALESVSSHSYQPSPDVDFVWNMENVGGTSGLFATKIALALGSKKIILCGIPMDNSGHYFDPPKAKDNDSASFGGGSIDMPWRDLMKSAIAKDRVRSMSGKTMAMFKKPTKEWVES